MNESYFEWLLERVEVYSRKDFKYNKLFKWLLEEPFVWLIRNDENRSADGLELRYEYLNLGGKLPKWMGEDDPCSVLEMLVALSIRCDRDLIGSPDTYKGGKLFWIMVENLGLDAYDDSNFDEKSVAEVVDIWMKRQFKEDGTGSIFCVKNRVKTLVRNQKNIEIWFQMCDFINENYDFSW